MKKANRFLRKLTFTSALILFPLQLQAQALNVYDSKNAKIGPLLSENHVGVTVNGKLISVRFKSPGFNVDFDQNAFVTVYYTTTDCTGTVYYSDQADGKWVENATPSMFDVPLQGILVGITPSTLDPNKNTPMNPPEFFSKVTVYYPDPAQGLKSVAIKSSRQYGSAGILFPCNQSANPGPVATIASGIVNYAPPFSAR